MVGPSVLNFIRYGRGLHNMLKANTREKCDNKDMALRFFLPVIANQTARQYQPATWNQRTRDRSPPFSGGEIVGRSKTERRRRENVLAHLYLVKAIARRTRIRGDLSFEDLVQYGVLGLMKAAKRYDVSLNTKFSTYAAFWIRQSINRAVIFQGRLVKLPSYLAERMPEYLSAHRYLQKKNRGRDPSPEEVAAELGWSPAHVLALMACLSNNYSLDFEVDQLPGIDLYEHYCSTDELNPESILCDKEKYDCLRAVLGELKEKERYIVGRRYGLDDRESETLEEIGKHLGLTKERVRQIQEATLRKMRQKLQKKFRPKHRFRVEGKI